MNPWFLASSLSALVWVALGFGLIVYLAPRKIPHLVVWPLALLIGVGLACAATATVRHILGDGVPTAHLLKAYARSYVIPIVAMTLAATGLRSWSRSRVLGSILLFVFFVGVMVVMYYATDLPFEIVNASA